MTRRRVLMIVAAMFVAAALVVVSWPGEREPEYQGRKLSEWLDVYAATNPAENPEALAAIRHIGTNGIPSYLRWSKYEVPLWKMNLGKWVDKAPHLPRAFIRERLFGGGKNAHRACLGLYLLGEQAAPAVPRLEQRLRENRSKHPYPVLLALRYSGSDGLQSVLGVITNRAIDSSVRGSAISTLLSGGDPKLPDANFSDVGPALLSVQGDHDAQIASMARMTLGALTNEVTTEH